MWKTLWAKLKGLVQYEPALIAWAANGGIAAIIAFWVHVSPTQAAAITTITTALAGIYTAIMTRPIAVSLITGAMASIFTASAAFGLHLPAALTAAVISVLSAVLGPLLRQAITPAVKLRPPATPPTPAAA